MKKKQNNVAAGGESAETFVLLIWEEIPETTKLYLIPSCELTDEDLEVLRAANGGLINGDNTTDEQLDALDKLSNAICDTEECVAEQYRGTRWATRLSKHVVEQDAPIEGKAIVAVYRGGFIL